METKAYADFYLAEAKRRLGSCTDYLINDCLLQADRVGEIYAMSPVMAAFGRGEPRAVSGLSGVELGMRLYREYTNADAVPAYRPKQDGRTREYWAGWALAQLQWHLARPFKWIFARTRFSDILVRYGVYHEMDVARFVEDVGAELEKTILEPNLRRIRRAAGLSQSQLASSAGVNVRNIQLYEQRVQDINHATAATLARIARVLSCSIEDLME